MITVRLCRSAECHRELRDDEAGPYCYLCAEEVEAFRLDYEGWQHVIAEHNGEEQAGPQCPGCGAAGYTRRGDHMVCTGDDLQPGGCGSRYPIDWQPARLVVF